MELYWDTIEYLNQGGWIMLPLMAVSVVMWTLIVDRWRQLESLRGPRLPGLLAEEFLRRWGELDPRKALSYLGPDAMLSVPCHTDFQHPVGVVEANRPQPWARSDRGAGDHSSHS